ncbi:TPA: hypothetical protein ACOEAN_001143 [Enterobacter asburiae]
MKGYVLILGGLLSSFSASAGRITMSNPVQTTTENGMTLCVYGNNVYTFVYKTRSKHCPYSKSFNTSDDDKQ